MSDLIKPVLDTRKMTTTGKNAGKYHIKIRVTFVRDGDEKKWIPKLFKTNQYATAAEFSLVEGNSQKEYIREIRAKVLECQTHAVSVFKTVGNSPEEFERLYYNVGSTDNLVAFFKMYIGLLREEGRDGTADSYSQALNSFIAFKNGSDYISFKEVTVEWLKRYERWMIAAGKSKATIGIYTRPLRAVMNLAASKKYRIIAKDDVPFGRDGFKIKKVRRTNKKAHSVDEKNILLSYRSDDERINRALDFWKFQYYCNGCNVADVAYLKFQNVQKDVIIFDRKKTENTEKDSEPILVVMRDEIREVINKHGNKSVNPFEYVFPILNNEMTSKERKDTIKQFTKITNKYLKKANDKLKLEIKPTTGTARYTFSTILKKLGVETSDIQKLLGHGSEQTTEHYLESFNDDKRKRIANML